jgi:hypothetical protein
MADHGHMSNDFMGEGIIHLAPGFTTADGKTVIPTDRFLIRNGFVEVDGSDSREIFPAGAILRIEAKKVPNPGIRVNR